jgi:hypothetical protein
VMCKGSPYCTTDVSHNPSSDSLVFLELSLLPAFNVKRKIKIKKIKLNIEILRFNVKNPLM